MPLVNKFLPRLEASVGWTIYNYLINKSIRGMRTNEQTSPVKHKSIVKSAKPKGKTKKKAASHKKQQIQDDYRMKEKLIQFDFRQYGFSEHLGQSSAGKISELAKTCSIFMQNPNVEQVQWKNLCSEMLGNFQKPQIIVQRKQTSALVDQNCQQIQEISKHQSIIWKNLNSLLLLKSSEGLSPGSAGLFGQHKQRLQDFLIRFSGQQQRQQQNNYEQQISELYQQNLQQVAFKTFACSLSETSIDQLNYFLEKQIQQSGRAKKSDKSVGTWSEWASFIQKKRVKLRKSNKFILHTACELCLSPYSEQCNPIKNCPECHLRGHSLCLETTKVQRCGRCIYLRLPNQFKSKIPECFLCSVTGLIPLKITSSKFAHIFCLFAHRMWKMENFKISIDSHRQQASAHESQQACCFCNKESVHYTQCTVCKKYCHYLCAFMSGCRLTVSQGRAVQVRCCELAEPQAQRLACQRKYVLNHDNIVFKKLNSLKKAGGSQKKSRPSTTTDIRIETEEEPMFEDEKLYGGKSVCLNEEWGRLHEDRDLSALEFLPEEI